MALHRSTLLVGPESASLVRVVDAGSACVAPTRKDKDEGSSSERNKLNCPWDPFLLAGPVVRRMEPDRGRVWIWLATSVAVEVEARAGSESTVSPEFWDHAEERAKGRGEASSYRAGRRLYITLVPIDLEGEIEHGRYEEGEPPLAYNMSLALPEDSTYALESDGPSPCAIHGSRVALHGFEYPTLLFENEALRAHRETVFLHASCRKPHGGDEDATSRMLEQMDESAKDVYARPTALFLTGDQIYADDVHADLIGPVRKLSREIVGKESLPGRDGPTHAIGANARAAVVEGGFSSTHAANHLLGYGEYAAMYLLAWSGPLWERYVEEPSQPLSSYAPADAQRLLANIPTYMMFDDHEVTDDWNLNHAWYVRAWKDAVTRRVVTNGLTAFAVFQGEGNDPARLAGQLRPGISWSGILMDPGSHPSVSTDAQAWSTHWDYVAGTPQPAVVLDTRTRRWLEKGSPFPGLLNGNALTVLHEALGALQGGSGEPVVLVSPAPVLGYELIEAIQRAAAKHTLSETVDSEAWSLHEESFVAFLDTLLHLSERTRFVVLSGDVHHGFVGAARYDYLLRAIEIAQFTSSPSRNDSPSLFSVLGGDRSLVKSLVEQPHSLSPKDGSSTLRWSVFDVTTETNAGRVRIDSTTKVSQSLLLSSGTVDRVVTWGDLPYVDS